MVAILGDRRWPHARGETGKGGNRKWPHAAKRERDKTSKTFGCNVWKQRSEQRPTVGGVSFRSRIGAPSPKRCVVNGQMTVASNV